MKNVYSRSLGGVAKNEAGVIATGVVFGAAVGTTAGYMVSQVGGTPLVPSMIVGGVTGGVVGGSVGLYVGHRMDQARASAVQEAEFLIHQRMGTTPKDQGDELAEKFVAELVRQAPAIAQGFEDATSPAPN